MTRQIKKYLVEWGSKIGFLTVGERVTNLKTHELTNSTKRSYLFQGAVRECECDCGNHILMSEAALRSGRVKSCGCLRAHNQAQALAHRERMIQLERTYKQAKNELLMAKELFTLHYSQPMNGVRNQERLLQLAEEIKRHLGIVRGLKHRMTTLRTNKKLES